MLFVIDDVKIHVTTSGLRRLSMSHARVGLLRTDIGALAFEFLIVNTTWQLLQAQQEAIANVVTKEAAKCVSRTMIFVPIAN